MQGHCFEQMDACVPVKAMKRAKAQPSLAGLLLIVTGMLLLSIVILGLVSGGNLSRDGARVMAGVGCVAVASLAGGAVLSNRKRH